MPLIFVTGGAGYVGSHCVLNLLEHNFDVIVADNCCNATKNSTDALPESLKRVQQLSGKQLKGYYEIDILDYNSIDGIFTKHEFDAVMHFAALKSVGESVAKPLDYYQNNVTGTIKLLQIMKKHNVKRFIFSSSATVYGLPNYLPLDEKHPTGQTCTNPYGKSKFMVEEILKDLCASDSQFSVASLRYFNPVGAHSSGDIGEDPQEIPNNLMPFVSQVAVGRRPYLSVFGNDFNTKDGTGVRDYIHIEDLANGHVMTLKKMIDRNWNGFNAINLGTGSGYSVLEIIKAFESASGVKIPYKIVERRPGDVDSVYGDPKLANDKLNWRAEKSIEDMCASAWKWQSKNPLGYAKK